MRILYAIQGTGNGLLTRALDIVPLLRQCCAQLDVLVSGPPADLPLPFKMGVPIVKNLKNKNLAVLAEWLSRGQPVPVHYPDQTAAMLDQLLHEQRPAAISSQAAPA